jgi:hypothetical protein
MFNTILSFSQSAFLTAGSAHIKALTDSPPPAAEARRYNAQQFFPLVLTSDDALGPGEMSQGCQARLRQGT